MASLLKSQKYATPVPSLNWLQSLPFGWDVFFLFGEGSEAVVSEKGRAVLLDEAFDGLTPPAGVSVAAALQHERPAKRQFLFAPQSDGRM